MVSSSSLVVQANRFPIIRDGALRGRYTCKVEYGTSEKQHREIYTDSGVSYHETKLIRFPSMHFCSTGECLSWTLVSDAPPAMLNDFHPLSASSPCRIELPVLPSL